MAEPSALLIRNLAASIDLYTRQKHAHWNVTGPAFIGVHKLFDELAENTEGYSDTMAERARYLGVEAYGTARAAAKSFLPPYTIGIADTAAHLSAIDDSITKLSASTRSAIGECLSARDQASADVFIEVTRGLDHDCYLVRSHL